jgi:L-iditol 2-dehydrogenase
MKAVMKIGPGEDGVRVLDAPEPEAPAGYARILVQAAGICGTDVHIARDEYASKQPVIMGHEILGTVDSIVGDSDRKDLLGKRVTTETYFYTCGGCVWCRDGRPNLCPGRRSIGSFENGGFACYVVVPTKNLHKIPDFLDGNAGVLSEPLACVTHSLLDPPQINAGDKVLVVGPGTIGQLAAQVALAQGANVTLLGLPQDKDRLAIAESFGITAVTSEPSTGSFDVVVECSGHPDGAAAALRAARRGGRYVQIGIFGRDVTLPMDLILYKELQVSSGFASTPASWRRALALIESRKVTLGSLITLEAPIADWDSAFAIAKKGGGLKTVILPE